MQVVSKDHSISELAPETDSLNIMHSPNKIILNASQPCKIALYNEPVTNCDETLNASQPCKTALYNEPVTNCDETLNASQPCKIALYNEPVTNCDETFDTAINEGIRLSSARFVVECYFDTCTL